MVATEIQRTALNGKFFASHRWDNQYKYWQLLKTWQTYGGKFYKETVYND